MACNHEKDMGSYITLPLIYHWISQIFWTICFLNNSEKKGQIINNTLFQDFNNQGQMKKVWFWRSIFWFNCMAVCIKTYSIICCSQRIKVKILTLATSIFLRVVLFCLRAANSNWTQNFFSGLFHQNIVLIKCYCFG